MARGCSGVAWMEWSVAQMSKSNTWKLVGSVIRDGSGTWRGAKDPPLM